MKKSSKSVWSRFVMTFAAAFFVVLATTVPVKADSSVPLVKDIKQTDASTTSAGISWSCPGSGVRFKIVMSEQMSGDDDWLYKESQSSASITFTKLSAGQVYYVWITPFKYNIEGLGKYTKVMGTTSQPFRIVTAPDTAQANLTHTKSSTNTIGIKWSAVPGADTYEVEYYIDSSKARKCVTTKTGVTLKKLAKNETYTIYVTAGRRYADGTTTAWSDNDLYKWGIPVKPSKVSGVDVTHYWQNLSEICVENSRIGCADGYQYQLYTAYKDKDSKIKTVTTSSAYTYIKTSALKKHNFYKVKVRAYALNSKNEKMYGDWSSWKYVSPQPDVTKIKNNKSKKGIQISWDKIKGANRYVVYVSTKKDSGYKKFQTTTKTGTVIKKCGKNKLKSGKNYYFYVEPQKKVGNKYVSGLAGNANYCWSLKYKK